MLLGRVADRNVCVYLTGSVFQVPVTAEINMPGAIVAGSNIGVCQFGESVDK